MSETGIVMAAIVFGYLLGAIPFGLIFARMAGLGDVRKIGSGNIGATNVLRTGRKDIAFATLVADMLKGTLAVVLVLWLGTPFAALMAGLFAFLGHLYPVWLSFKGGKGVATYIGVLLAVSWQALLVFAAVWLSMAALFRYSSLAGLSAVAITPIAVWYFNAPQPAIVFLLMSVISFVKHRANIKRLLSGSESRIGDKS
jgi:glycerol-3-phosphate acyltransferase PlsY